MYHNSTRPAVPVAAGAAADDNAVTAAAIKK
jgi:hypothetical protein